MPTINFTAEELKDLLAGDQENITEGAKGYAALKKEYLKHHDSVETHLEHAHQENQAAEPNHSKLAGLHTTIASHHESMARMAHDIADHDLSNSHWAQRDAHMGLASAHTEIAGAQTRLKIAAGKAKELIKQHANNHYDHEEDEPKF